MIKTILNDIGLVPILKGMGTYVPGMTRFIQKRSGATLGTASARYCYAVWLRHLVMANKSGVIKHPKIVAELGPGDSLGVGMAALISGADVFYALDVIEFANNDFNVIIFDELVELFANRKPIPDSHEFPRCKPLLDSYEFPSNLLSDDYLKSMLSGNRLANIRKSILSISNNSTESNPIKYIVPWDKDDIILEHSVDMIISQAVLEHVNDLNVAYSAMYKWLKPDGFLSNTIDFKSHRTSVNWNGHWAYSDFIWKLIVGKRKYLLNRQPYSAHINLLKDTGFRIICNIRNIKESSINRKKLAKRFINISQEDLETSDAFIQAVPR